MIKDNIFDGYYCRAIKFDEHGWERPHRASKATANCKLLMMTKEVDANGAYDARLIRGLPGLNRRYAFMINFRAGPFAIGLHENSPLG